MKYCFTLLVLFLSLYIVNAQAAQYQLFRTNPCNSTPFPESQYYFLTDTIGTEYGSFREADNNTLISDIITLPSPGKYIVYRITEPSVESYEININPGMNTETINDPKIMYRIPFTIDPDYIYENCGKPCEGYNEDFYPNGTIKIRGVFDEGTPTDSIAKYYSNGKVKYRKYNKNSGSYMTHYDSIGHKIVSAWSESGSYMTYKNKSATVYFLNGKVKWEKSDINHIVKAKEFYPNGKPKVIQTKKKRTEYFENGKIATEYRWKRKKDHTLAHAYDFKITITHFDRNGYLIDKNTEDDEGDYPQPYFAYRLTEGYKFWEEINNN